jgi:RNA polymerase sigma factor (sigma-70 family)
MTTSRTEGVADRAAEAFTAYRLGDLDRMADLVEMLTPLLWHVARAQNLDQDAAEDVVQAAWLRLVEKATTIESPQAVLAWLITTVRREAWRTAKASSHVVPEDQDFDATGIADARDLPPDGATGADPAAVAVLSERQNALWLHVRDLSPRCQELLRIIAFVDRPDYAGVSAALHMPVGSIGPTRGRCLASLRKALLADPVWSAS